MLDKILKVAIKTAGGYFRNEYQKKSFDKKINAKTEVIANVPCYFWMQGIYQLSQSGQCAVSKDTIYFQPVGSRPMLAPGKKEILISSFLYTKEVYKPMFGPAMTELRFNLEGKDAYFRFKQSDCEIFERAIGRI